MQYAVSTLVLLPGMDGTGELFAPFIKALPPELQARVVRYPAQPLGYPELLEVVKSALPTDSPYCLVAESFSGPLGIEIAAHAPPNLKKLVLCCTFAKNPRPALGKIGPLISLLSFSSTLLTVLGRRLMGSYFDASLQAALVSALAQVPPAVLRARLRAVLDVDVTDQLQKIQVPTLYLQAADDQVVSRPALRLLLAHKPDMEVARLSGPHFLLQTQPLRVAQALEAFLDTAA